MWSGNKLNNKSWAGILTKKEMKMVAFISIKAMMVVQRYPRRFVMGPAKNTPTKAPHCPDWKRALCHLVGIVKPSCPATLTPYFF